jgi:Ala-tRNA(Pro) deacylase
MAAARLSSRPGMPATSAELFERLDALGIQHRTYHHLPVHTVADAVRLRGRLPGGHCKSLFLKDRKNGLWLVVTLENRTLDLKTLADQLGAPRFSFASPALLHETLGVLPGSVTPFALMNQSAKDVRVVLEEEMLAEDPLNYHPLVNTATTAIASADLLRFLRASGHEPRLVPLGAQG